jgi:hypothetical protein
MNDENAKPQEQQKPTSPADEAEADSQALSERVQEEAAKDRKQQGGYQ